LAFLWLRVGKSRAPFDAFWRAMREPKRVWTFSAADRALAELYAALGLDRPADVSMKMWKRWHEHEGSAGQEPDQSP
jgi:hypothetical protein